MIYLVKKEGGAIPFYNESEMKKAGFSKADKTVSDDEFAANGCYARLVGGAIVVGKTEAEKQSEENQKRVSELKQMLIDTDYIAVKIAEGSSTKADYADKISERCAWRQELRELLNLDAARPDAA
jgi:hypothetical protein